MVRAIPPLQLVKEERLTDTKREELLRLIRETK